MLHLAPQLHPGHPTASAAAPGRLLPCCRHISTPRRRQPLHRPRFQPELQQQLTSDDEAVLPPGTPAPPPPQQQPEHHHNYQQQQQHGAAWVSPSSQHGAAPTHQLEPRPLPGAHPPLKYAQMGHSRFARGAPHVCYLHMGAEQGGLFYAAPDRQQHDRHARGDSAQQQQQQPPRANSQPWQQGLRQALQRARRAAAAALPGQSRWPGLTRKQVLLGAAAAVVAGLALLHVLRSVVAGLVACYSGFPVSP